MFAPALAFAQVGDAESLANRITEIINLIIPIIIALAVVYFLWGVFQYAIAGDEEKKKSAKDTMIYGVIAIFVMVSVWGLVNILVGTFGLNTGAPDVPELPIGR